MNNIYKQEYFTFKCWQNFKYNTPLIEWHVQFTHVTLKLPFQKSMFLFLKTGYFYCGSSIEVTCTFLSSATMGKIALFNIDKLLYILFIRLRFKLGPAVNRACPLNGESFEITRTFPLRYLY